MSKRKNYEKASYKTKKPISMRLNEGHLDVAMYISGCKKVGELIDYLLHKYVTENGKSLIAPITYIDDRPIDEPDMPMWTPKPKKEIKQYNFDDAKSSFIDNEMKRLNDIKERMNKISSK